MEIVHILDLERSPAQTNLKPWIASSGFFCWGLMPGKTVGYLTTPECQARLGYNFQGFQIVPYEAWVSVAVIRPPNQPMRFEDGMWVETTDPVFVNCETIRETLPMWGGSIKFILKIEQIPDRYNLPVTIGTPQENYTTNFTVDVPPALTGTPFVSQVKLGFSVASGDMVDYGLNFALPNRLGKPVELTRTVIVGEDGISLAMPPGIAKEKISNVSFLAPGLCLIPATVGESAIMLKKQFIPGTRGVLVFSFTPIIEAAGEIFQVSDIPSIALMPIEEQNRQYMNIPEYIKVANQKRFKWEGVYTFDQVVEITVIAQDAKDTRTMCDRLLAIINSQETAFLEMHPWGKKIPISLVGGVDSGTKLRVLPGLNVQSFRIVLGGLVRGAIGTVLEN
jgi:hypothetical protein